MNKNMIALAKDNTIRVSPFKLNDVVRLIVNQKVDKAINQLKFSQKRISNSVLKVLNSAIANAENNKNPESGDGNDMDGVAALKSEGDGDDDEYEVDS